MNDLNPREFIGGNNPPAFDPEKLQSCKGLVDDFNSAAKEWLDLKEIATPEQSGKLTDFVSGARQVYSSIDTARKAEKKPHDDAGKAVQAAFTPLLDTIDQIINRVKPMQAAWLQKLAREENARREKLRVEAEQARIAAEEAQKAAAQTNDVAGEVEAERLKAEADQLAADAARQTTVKAGSATGAGRTMALRTINDVVVTNPLKVFMRYRDHPDVLEVLRKVASAEVRAASWKDGDTIDGADIVPRQVAA